MMAVFARTGMHMCSVHLHAGGPIHLNWYAAGALNLTAVQMHGSAPGTMCIQGHAPAHMQLSNWEQQLCPCRYYVPIEINRTACPGGVRCHFSNSADRVQISAAAKQSIAAMPCLQPCLTVMLKLRYAARGR